MNRCSECGQYIYDGSERLRLLVEVFSQLTEADQAEVIVYAEYLASRKAKGARAR